MKYAISFVMPGIRTSLWVQDYNSIKESCTRYSFEVIFAGPFDPPAELVNIPNVKCIKTYTSPSCAVQMGAEAAEGTLYMGIADDALYVPKEMDNAIDLYHKSCGSKDMVNVRYTEDVNYTGKTKPPGFWLAHSHPTLSRPGVPHHYRFCMIPLLNANYYRELGGLDCECEYPNFNVIDFSLRLQAAGGSIIDTDTDVCHCNMWANCGDHVPIEQAYVHDLEVFARKYDNPNAFNEEGSIKIPFDNYKKYPEPWSRRFANKLYTSYEEMIHG